MRCFLAAFLIFAVADTLVVRNRLHIGWLFAVAAVFFLPFLLLLVAKSRAARRIAVSQASRVETFLLHTRKIDCREFDGAFVMFSAAFLGDRIAGGGRGEATDSAAQGLYAVFVLIAFLAVTYGSLKLYAKIFAGPPRDTRTRTLLWQPAALFFVFVLVPFLVGFHIRPVP